MISVSGIYLLIVCISASCNFTSSRYVCGAIDGWTGGSQFDFMWKGYSLSFPWKIYCGCICLAKALKSFNNSTLTWTVFVGGWTDHLASYISKSTTEILIHSFVRAKLDFGNSLLFGAQKRYIVKLQSIQNAAFRIIAGVKKQDHITETLRDLHWLPVEKRIVFKINLISFKTLGDSGPHYLEDILKFYYQSRTLQSLRDHLCLEEPNFNIKTYGQRAFSVAAPRLWNKLPFEIRACSGVNLFKSKLKTCLCKKVYDI